MRRLRDLPGIMDVEALLVAAEARPNPKWSDEWTRAIDLANQHSKRLFGITEADTRLDETVRKDDAWWSAYHEREDLFRENDNSPVDIADFDWDATDSGGAPLRCLEMFRRQLIAAEVGAMGRLPEDGPTDAEIAANSDTWRSSLEAEAAKFKTRRKA